MTAFFVPGVANNPRATEAAYRDMSGVIELEMGRRPNARRILRLWTRTDESSTEHFAGDETIA